jgi:ribosomal protein S18 acetylase RimI-like enzyme
MTAAIRAMRLDDADACGRVAYDAHRAVAAAHGFPPEHPSVDFSIGLIKAKLSDPNAYGCLAEDGGRILGSAFLTTFPPVPVAAVGPLTVHPSAEGGVGRHLMEHLLAEAAGRGLERVRLVQSPSHLRSLALYAKMGFTVRDPLVLMHGAIPPFPGGGDYRVHAARPEDVERCNAVCTRVHGFARGYELGGAVRQQNALVVERAGRITGYLAGLGLRGHAAADTAGDLKALIASAGGIAGPGFFVPLRSGELFSWLLQSGLHALWPANLMTRGPYQEPAGAYLPAIAF